MSKLIDVHQPGEAVFTLAPSGTVFAYLVQPDGRLHACTIDEALAEPPEPLRSYDGTPVAAPHPMTWQADALAARGEAVHLPMDDPGDDLPPDERIRNGL